MEDKNEPTEVFTMTPTMDAYENCRCMMVRRQMKTSEIGNVALGETANIMFISVMIGFQAVKHVGKTSKSLKCRSGQEE